MLYLSAALQGVAFWVYNSICAVAQLSLKLQPKKHAAGQATAEDCVAGLQPAYIVVPLTLDKSGMGL